MTTKTKFNGAVTEIVVLQGDQELTYLLREHGGEVRVDDILLPAEGRSKSLKQTAELIVPLREFTAGLQMRDMGLVQRTSSTDYNRLVWRQTDRMPELTASALRHLRMPVTGVEAKEDSVLLTLGDARWGAKVMLTKEHSQLVVDEVELVAGVEAKQRLRLKVAMRQELAHGGMVAGDYDERTTARPNLVMNLGYEVDAEDEDSEEMSHAGGVTIAPQHRQGTHREPARLAAPRGGIRQETLRPAMPHRLPPPDELEADDAELSPPDPSDDAFAPPTDVGEPPPASSRPSRSTPAPVRAKSTR